MRWRWIGILPTAHFAIGIGKLFMGRAEETEAHILEALRLSPRDPVAYVWMANAGTAMNQLGSWKEAVAWSRRAIEANPNFPHPHFVMGAALAHLGRLDEAIPRSRPASRSTPPSRSHALAPIGRR